MVDDTQLESFTSSARIFVVPPRPLGLELLDVSSAAGGFLTARGGGRGRSGQPVMMRCCRAGRWGGRPGRPAASPLALRPEEAGRAASESSPNWSGMTLRLKGGARRLRGRIHLGGRYSKTQGLVGPGKQSWPAQQARPCSCRLSTDPSSSTSHCMTTTL